MEPLTSLERALLAACLEGDDPILADLRGQADIVSVCQRVLTGDGFITAFAFSQQASPVRFLASVQRLLIDDVYGELLDHDSPGFAHLNICQGYLDCLEFFCTGGGWPDPAIWTRLTYIEPLISNGPQPIELTNTRDLDALRQKWASA